VSRFPRPQPHRSSRRQPRIHIPSINLGDIDPGSIRNPAVPRRGLALDAISADSFINGFDGTATPEFIIKGDPNWVRPGGNGSNEDLRVRLGYISTPLQCDFKGQIGLSNNSPTNANFHVALCAVLYTSNASSGSVYQRSEAFSSTYMLANNFSYTLPLVTSFIVPASFEVTDPSTGDAADWYFGYQVQATDGANHNGFQINKQSITCTFYASPFYGTEDNSQDGSNFDTYLPRTVPDSHLG
jgi:hypothetical protein